MHSEALLAALPEPIRKQLLEEFNKLLDDYREARWEGSEMSGGKLCEVVYSILRGYLDGTIPERHEHGPRNMVLALTKLEDYPASMGRPARIQIPRILLGVYELRNNRGVGHAGGDVKPNHMDATYIVGAAKWVMAELIRMFHQVDSKVASESVELLTEREIPVIWSIKGTKRVLSGGTNKHEETVLLLYSVKEASDKQLFEWVEYSNFSVFKAKILTQGHKQRYWEYDKTTGTVTLSAIGVMNAEAILRRASRF